MRLKTITALIITVLLTVVIMQNTEPEWFTVVFVRIQIPKLVMLTAFSVSGFILGVLVAWPKKRKPIDTHYPDGDRGNFKTRTLSDEDKDYIN
jgi:uncharacterized integral membrane protein